MCQQAEIRRPGIPPRIVAPFLATLHELTSQLAGARWDHGWGAVGNEEMM